MCSDWLQMAVSSVRQTLYFNRKDLRQNDAMHKHEFFKGLKTEKVLFTIYWIQYSVYTNTDSSVLFHGLLRLDIKDTITGMSK